MKTTAVDIHRCFQPIFGTRPWRVGLGVGSFLTFEFGSRMRSRGHLHGQWHLWIYLSYWALFHGDRQLVDSNADRKLISVSIRRLEESELTSIDFDRRTRTTAFTFGDFRLVVSATEDQDSMDDRDHYWMFFVPNNEVLTVGPAGIKMEQADASQHA